MRWRASHHGIPCGFAIMDVKTMDNDVSHKLDCDASAISNVYIYPSSINCLKTVHDEFLFQSNHHVPFEHDPKRFLLNNSMTKCPWLRVHRIVVTRISDNIETAITSTNSIPSKSNATFRKAFTVTVPIGVATPAVVNGIPCSTGEESQLPPFSAITDTPAISKKDPNTNSLLEIVVKTLDTYKSRGKNKKKNRICREPNDRGVGRADFSS